MKNRKFLGGLAMLALVIIGIGTLLNFILGQFFPGKLGQVIDIVVHIVTILGFIFVALYAYDWVDSAPKSKKGTYKILYFISIVVIIVFYVLRLI